MTESRSTGMWSFSTLLTQSVVPGSCSPASPGSSPRGVPYSLNLVRCRRALVDCQVRGDFESMEQLADAVGVSRSTASPFFSGRPTSLSVTKRILDALGLKFEDVLTPESEDDAA